MNSASDLFDVKAIADASRASLTNDWLPGFIDPVSDARVIRECWREAQLKPGQLHPLPAEVLSGLLLPGLLPAGLAVLMLVLARAGMPFSLGRHGTHAGVANWVCEHTGARWVDRPAEACLVAINAADAQADLLAELPSRPAPHGGATGAVLCIDVPELHAAPPPLRLEPGDMELTSRIRLSGNGMASPRVLAVGGVNRGFWRARAIRQANAAFGVDIVLVHQRKFCVVPAATHLCLDH